MLKEIRSHRDGSSKTHQIAAHLLLPAFLSFPACSPAFFFSIGTFKLACNLVVQIYVHPHTLWLYTIF